VLQTQPVHFTVFCCKMSPSCEAVMEMQDIWGEKLSNKDTCLVDISDASNCHVHVLVYYCLFYQLVCSSNDKRGF